MVTFVFRMPRKAREGLRRQARAEGLTPSAWLRCLLTSALDSVEARAAVAPEVAELENIAATLAATLRREA